MRALEAVLDERTGDLAEVLVRGCGLSEERALCFVTLAGPDLIDSFLWHSPGPARRRLAEPATARDVLSTMGANRLARTLGLTRAEVWEGLRALVPRVLCLAEYRRAA